MLKTLLWHVSKKKGYPTKKVGQPLKVYINVAFLRNVFKTKDHIAGDEYPYFSQIAFVSPEST